MSIAIYGGGVCLIQQDNVFYVSWTAGIVLPESLASEFEPGWGMGKVGSCSEDEAGTHVTWSI